MNIKLNKQPSDPYDTNAWMNFYAANPNFRRTVGAAGDNDDANAEAEAAQAEAAKAESEAEAAKAAEANAQKLADEETAKNKDGKPSDAEAELLKDLMKHKEARKAAEARLKEFDGIDVAEYKDIKAKQAEAAAATKAAEEKALIDKGDFDKVRAQMNEQHETALTAKDQELETSQGEIAKLKAVIEDLTVGTDFSSSKFISEGTVFTPSKARRLYSDHFEVENGKTVGYDKPRGSEGRAPIVDAKGNAADFDTAMRRIIDADPEKEDILTASLKPGANSEPGKGDIPGKKNPVQTSRDKIGNGLSDLMKSINSPSDGGVKL